VAGCERTIVDEWRDVEVPSAPELHAVTVDASSTALLVLDMQKQNCNEERRPRCVASITTVRSLLDAARNAGAPVLYSLTSSARPADIRGEMAPRPDEPVVKSGVDKFHGTQLEALLRQRGIKAVILVGTSAHGAVLHTATGAALRGFEVIVPVDGMSAGEPYAEQYTSWHLANGPGTRRRCTLTRCNMVSFAPAES
jgi:nicotinamidase-related amidase